MRHLLLALLLLVPQGGQAPQKTPSQKKPSPPVIEKITESVYRIGNVTIDTVARTATCSGEINMDRGAVEYLAVAPRGKVHESLLLLKVRPLHLQLALLLLDLEPKNVLEAQGDKKVPEGDPVTLWVRWHDKKESVREVRAEELLLRQPTSRSVKPQNWVFTGSRILKEGFEADIAKSLIAIWHDPAAILDNPAPEGSENSYVVNSDRVPKRGTRIELIVKALPKMPSAQTKVPK